MQTGQPYTYRKQAFTLIELLAAVGILMIIVTLVGVIFTESDRAWTLGTNRSDVNLEGRAALNMIAHDLQYAIAYANDDPEYQVHFLGRRDKYDLKSYGFPNDEVSFVSLQNDSSDGNRAVREVFYYVREMEVDSTPIGRYELVRAYYDDEIFDGPSTGIDHCYYATDCSTDTADPDLWTESRPTDTAHFIARNVSGFAVYSYTNNGEVTSFMNTADPAQSNRLPEYVDVCLELLPERRAKQAAALPAATVTNFVTRHSMRYATRVYFHNRDGYKER